MRRFFFEHQRLSDTPLIPLNQLAIGSRLPLTEDIYHHWCRVLRAKVGDQSLIFDGLGGQSVIALESIDKKSAEARIVLHENVDNDCAFYSTIALVMSRGDRMDYAIQKSTELGATAIQLLTSQHGEVRLKASQIDKKLNHWQQVALSACEQCGLNRPPLIFSPLSIEEWLQQQANPSQEVGNFINSKPHHDVAYLAESEYYRHYLKQPTLPLVLAVPSQQEQQQLDVIGSIQQHFDSSKSCLETPRFDILIGAEGGLSESEYVTARSMGYLPWQLGNRVLRTETAPVVALATLNYISNTL